MTSRTGDFDDLSGKVVLITGAATGIGRAIAVAFAAHGARTSIGDRNEGAAETLKLVESAGGEAIFRRTDVAVEDDVEKLVSDTIRHYPTLSDTIRHYPTLWPT